MKLLEVKNKRALEKLAKITLEKCKTCPSEEQEDEFRCCDKMFCDLVKNALPEEVNYEYKSDQKVPFMGKNGCVVKPEHRPFCAGFVCGPHLIDRKFRREYFRLCEKAGIPYCTQPEWLSKFSR